VKAYLCCGRKTGVGPGWTGFDLDPPADVLCDVRRLDPARFRGVEAVFATPPCDGFTDLPWRPATGEGVDTLMACLRICEQSGAPWLLENSRFARKYLGPAVCHRSGHYFWGPLAELVPEFTHYKGGHSGMDPLGRAALPRILP